MECRDCTELLTAFLDGELAPDQAQLVESHLEVCPSCALEYQSLKHCYELTAHVARLSPSAPPWHEMAARLQADVPPLSLLGRVRRLIPLAQPFRVVSATLAAFALVVVALTPSFLRDRELRQQFSRFVEQRESIALEHRRMLAQGQSSRYSNKLNPFVVRVSQSGQNPFRR